MKILVYSVALVAGMVFVSLTCNYLIDAWSSPITQPKRNFVRGIEIPAPATDPAVVVEVPEHMVKGAREELDRLKKAVEDERELRKSLSQELANYRRANEELRQTVDSLRDFSRSMSSRVERLEATAKKEEK